MTHHQVAIEKYGVASTLKVRDLAPRPPSDDEVAIDVAYSGVNFADIQMRLGFYPDAPKRPFVPGYEVSGKITAVGKGVTNVRIGDQVVAGTYFGGYASHAGWGVYCATKFAVEGISEALSIELSPLGIHATGE